MKRRLITVAFVGCGAAAQRVVNDKHAETQSYISVYPWMVDKCNGLLARKNLDPPVVSMGKGTSPGYSMVIC